MDLPCGCIIRLECHACCGSEDGCLNPTGHIAKRHVAYSVSAYCRWHKGGLSPAGKNRRLTIQILTGNAPVTTAPSAKKEVKKWPTRQY